MAESDGKTEKATPKRRKDTRKEGNVPKSKELGTFFSLLSFGITLMVFGEAFVEKMVKFISSMFNLIESGIDPIPFFKTISIELGWVFLYLAAIVLIFQFINQMIQVGILFSPKIVKPDIKKLNPKNYFKNIFSSKSIVEISKSIFIVVIMGFVLYVVLKSKTTEISGSTLQTWPNTLLMFWGYFKDVFLKMLLVLFFVGLLDFVYQRMHWEKQIKMKKQEVKDEHKQNEGNPEVKSRQRQMAMQMLKNDIRNRVPEATVIITNPTHYSVAIFYKKGEGPPKVLVKGIDHMALYMREIAKENRIPIYEAPPLARELYKRVNENEFIPQDLYQAMIEILKVLIQAGKIKVQ